MSQRQSANPAGRHLYMDFLRILSCFLVIVNHTNSYVFTVETPATPQWFLSIGWYYFSKMAVPLFVMASGATLLSRQDSYLRAGRRFLRIILVLIVFSYLYYLFGLWKTGWSWRQAVHFPGFLSAIWQERITDSFWYLYFYAGLLVMLPLLQRLAKSASKKDLRYLLMVSFGANALWPLITHYAPGLALPQYFDFPLFSIFIGLFFAGHYLHAYTNPKNIYLWLCPLVIALMLVLASHLTALEAARLPAGEKYWFMDERTAPAFPVVLCALSAMLFAKSAFAKREETRGFSARSVRVLLSLSACSFTIYLLQDLLIVETRYRVFVPLCGALPAFVAVLIWEIGVFAALLPIAWLLKRVPLLKKII